MCLNDLQSFTEGSLIYCVRSPIPDVVTAEDQYKYSSTLLVEKLKPGRVREMRIVSNLREAKL